MPKVKPENLDHVLFVREGFGSNYPGEGPNGSTVMLIMGTPEPVKNFANPDFVELLLNENPPVVVRCNENGTMENGKKHPSMGDEKPEIDPPGVPLAPVPPHAPALEATPPEG